MAELACSSHMCCRWNKSCSEYQGISNDWSLPCRPYCQAAEQFCKENTQLHYTGWPFVLQEQDRWITESSSLSQEEIERVFVHMRNTKSPAYQISVGAFILPGDLVLCGSGEVARDPKSPEYQITVVRAPNDPLV